jgi:hypothetical protein
MLDEKWKTYEHCFEVVVVVEDNRRKTLYSSKLVKKCKVFFEENELGAKATIIEYNTS